MEMDVEKRLDELDNEVEDIKEDIEDLKREDEQEEKEEDESRTLYLYITYTYSSTEHIFGLRTSKKVVVLDKEDEAGYTIPKRKENDVGDSTQQAVQLAKCLGVDAWEKVELLAEDDERIYYEIEISEEILRSIDTGYIIDSIKAPDLINCYKEREYL